MHIPNKVTICEVGLRDGLQNEKTLLQTADKLELARLIVAAGVPVIELGSFVSPKAVPQTADTDELYRALGDAPGVELRALIANLRGVDRAVACGCKKVKFNVSASRAHNLANLNKTPEESVAGFADCVAMAKDNGVAISGSISMPFGSPWESEIPPADVFAIIEAYQQAGVDEISLSDASGMAVPTQVWDIATKALKAYPDVSWWLHFHNTRGMAAANIIAAMDAGISQFDTSFAGLGGCPFVPGAAGNVATEDVVHMCSEMGVETGIDIDRCIAIAKRVRQLIDHPTDSYILRAGKSKNLFCEPPTRQVKNETSINK